MTNSTPRRLLISAYCCEPDAGSEQGFAWWWVHHCAEIHDVTVLTCSAQERAIERARAAGRSSDRVRFVYVPGPRRVSPSGVEIPFEQLRAYWWQLRAVGVARELVRAGNFDLGQHITIATWRLPSCLAFTGLPYVIGPLGGSEVLPIHFARKLGNGALRRTLWRRLLLRLAAMDPFVRRTLRRASRILVCGPSTWQQMSKRYADKSTLFPRAYPIPALADHRGAPLVQESPPPSLRIAWMSRMVPRKALELLLRALRDSRLGDCTLDVFGDGPLRRHHERQVVRWSLESRVHFRAHLPRVEMLRHLRGFDVFVFTSLRDMAGQAVSEALQLGLPCVVMDGGGPAALVGEAGALKVPVSTFDSTVESLVSTLESLKRHPDQRKALGARGQDWIRKLANPETLSEAREAIYRQVFGEAEPAPQEGQGQLRAAALEGGRGEAVTTPVDP